MAFMVFAVATVIGAIATIGVVLGGITDWATLAGVPMFLGAMIMAPFAAFVLKLLDKAIETAVKEAPRQAARG